MKKFILDVDSVGDDILAIFYAALKKNINIDAITTVVGASGDINQATLVALNSVARTGQNIPVFSGAEIPILANTNNQSGGDPVNFFEEYRWKFGSRLDEFNKKEISSVRTKEDLFAVDYIINKVKNDRVTIVTTGPLTNIGLALKADPEIANKIEKMFILGGAYRYPGNITPVSEYNIYADPEAANIVFNSGIDIVLIPLDVCENNEFSSSMLTRDCIEEMKYATKDSKLINYIENKYPIYIDMWREYFDLAGFPMDDVITTAIAFGFDKYTTTEKVHVDVELDGKYTRGQIIPHFWKQINKYPNRETKNIRIVTSIDGKAFIREFIEVIIEGCNKYGI